MLRFLVAGFGVSAALNPGQMSCESLLRFAKLHAQNTAEEMALVEIANSSTLEGTARKILSGILTASTHLIPALFVQKPECLSESAKLALMTFFRNVKELGPAKLVHLENLPDLSLRQVQVMRLLAASLPTHASPGSSTYYSHEADGRMTTLEALRVASFKEDQPPPLCLLQGAILDLFHPGDRIADWGSGPTGQQAAWFNATGLVTARAFDGAPGVGQISNGKVTEVNLISDPPEESVDWIWLVNVLDTVPPDSADELLKSLKFGAQGVVLTGPAEVVEKLSKIDFQLDEAKTAALRTRCDTQSDIYVFTVPN